MWQLPIRHTAIESLQSFPFSWRVFRKSLSSPSVIFQDNEASILVLTRGPTHSGRTKFIDVRVFHITDCIREGLYSLVYCPTDDMPADPATKPMHAKSDMIKLLRLLNAIREALQP